MWSTTRARNSSTSRPRAGDDPDGPGASPVGRLRGPAHRASRREIPLDSQSIDTVVVAYTLCTIADTATALGQLRRVLRPDGRLLFCEHGAAPDPDVRRWQDRMTPVWKRLSGGCHLNRAIPEVLEHGGFRIETLQTRYLPGWRPATFNYWGIAVPARGEVLAGCPGASHPIGWLPSGLDVLPME